MLSWRAWKITVPWRWFIGWETKSDCFNLKLCGIQVESTKAQPVKTTANLLLSEGNISVQAEGVMYVKFLHAEMGMGGFQCNESKASRNTEPGEPHHSKLQGPRDCQPLGPAICPGFVPPPGGWSCSPALLLVCCQSLIASHIHIVCGRKRSLFSKDTVGPCNLHVFSMGEDPC